FRLDEGILVEAIPDLMFFNVAGYMNIVDWKVWTGTGSVAREQLHVYAFAALKSGWWRNLSAQTVSLGEANQAAPWVAAEKPIRFRLDEGILVEAIPDLMFFNVAGYIEKHQ